MLICKNNLLINRVSLAPVKYGAFQMLSGFPPKQIENLN